MSGRSSHEWPIPLQRSEESGLLTMTDLAGPPPFIKAEPVIVLVTGTDRVYSCHLPFIQ